ncbi:YHYH protein [uncultured Roseobacter sp.]|uniref:YHYH protein n=1 Tax=uncultured Roseobacter sp. TaxID=114847 RepID=UPI002619CCB8|nr:YHYH protein [uncultured Roseobacter sp.]
MKRFLTLSLVLTGMAATADAHEDSPERLTQIVAMFAPNAIVGIPITPVAAEAPRRIGNLGPGVALNGVRTDGPAPADAILAAHTIAPFDDCGGHVNLGVGYHYHAVTSCSKEVSAAVADHAPIIGIAMDGHILHAQLDADGMEPSDLDA